MVTVRIDAEGNPSHLFPPITWDHGWSLSLQGDKGYHCMPKERLDFLEEYEALEAVIYGPFAGPVDPNTLDMPDDVKKKFTSVEISNPAVGVKLSWDDVEAVKLAILRASFTPNAGVPRGAIGWSEVSVFHGTSAEHAENIVEGGISMGKSSLGYFGEAFYVADDKELAISNYAEMSGDEDGGVVIEYTIVENAKILDLRNADDGQVWAESGLGDMIGFPGLAGKAVRAGVDGVYDRSVGGLAIYNPKALALVGPVLSSDRKPGI